jgi:hypothetical protein
MTGRYQEGLPSASAQSAFHNPLNTLFFCVTRRFSMDSAWAAGAGLKADPDFPAATTPLRGGEQADS